MKRMLKFYLKLKPQTRYRLIFFVLVSLIWVPVRDTGVEVYEPYQYSIDDVEENQVVFAYQYTNYAWGKQDDMWVICKDGTCVLKNLVGYRREGLTDEEWLERLDKFAQDPTNQEMNEKLILDKEMVNYCINLSSIKLKTRNGMLDDGGTETFYVVVGTGEERHLEIIQERLQTSSSCNDLTIQYVCDKISDICRIRH